MTTLEKWAEGFVSKCEEAGVNPDYLIATNQEAVEKMASAVIKQAEEKELEKRAFLGKLLSGLVRGIGRAGKGMVGRMGNTARGLGRFAMRHPLATGLGAGAGILGYNMMNRGGEDMYGPGGGGGMFDGFNPGMGLLPNLINGFGGGQRLGPNNGLFGPNMMYPGMPGGGGMYGPGGGGFNPYRDMTYQPPGYYGPRPRRMADMSQINRGNFGDMVNQFMNVTPDGRNTVHNLAKMVQNQTQRKDWWNSPGAVSGVLTPEEQAAAQGTGGQAAKGAKGGATAGAAGAKGAKGGTTPKGGGGTSGMLYDPTKDPSQATTAADVRAFGATAPGDFENHIRAEDEVGGPGN